MTASASASAVPCEPELLPHGHVGGGIRVGLGAAATLGIDGAAGYARLTYEGGFLPCPGQRGGLALLALGLEGYRGDGGSGLGLPAGFQLGYRLPPLVAWIDLGVDAVRVDEAAGDHGLGLYAPYGGADVGIEVGGVRILGEVRARYMWQIGADDRGQLTAGISVGRLWE